MYTWDLDALYTGIDSQEYVQDVELLQTKIADFSALANRLEAVDADSLEEVLRASNEMINLVGRLASYLSLRSSVETNNNDVKSEFGKLMHIYSTISEPQAKINNWIATITDLESLVKENDYVAEHEFYLQETLDNSQYQLSDKEEGLIARLSINGVSAWEDLYEYLAAALQIDYNGEKVTMTEIRNLAYSDDATVRKSAYEAELAGYKQIEDSLAYSLNSIKGHVNTIVDLRGYDSAIDMTLKDSRMEASTLQAMFDAIDEKLPVFRKYLQHKGKLLGHENGLPFYDLFAPIGDSDKKYSVEEAQAMVSTNFGTFSPDLQAMVDQAFRDDWVDYLPRANKRGGAFCSNLAMIKQSRVMTNFGGALSDVVTIAHELGHAYHGYRIEDHHPLNTDYVMPIAETASNFCELILSEAAMKTASDDEKIMLLENMISDSTQVIVDIYSRFLFEDEVLKRRKDRFIDADEMKEIMIDAQKKTYGDGLDENYLHPYMWACKGHYYSSGRNYYNFPYAYGGLFAKGLYKKYLAEGEPFVAKYDQMLTNTTIANCEDIGDMVDVNVREKEFWLESLSTIEDMIEEFIELTSH